MKDIFYVLIRILVTWVYSCQNPLNCILKIYVAFFKSQLYCNSKIRAPPTPTPSKKMQGQPTVQKFLFEAKTLYVVRYHEHRSSDLLPPHGLPIGT